MYGDILGTAPLYTVHYHSQGTLLVNCVAETKQQTSIAPILQRNEKRVILADTLAQYNQYGEEEVVKELHPLNMCLLFPVVFVNKCVTFMHPKAKFECHSKWLDFFLLPPSKYSIYCIPTLACLHSSERTCCIVF